MLPSNLEQLARQVGAGDAEACRAFEQNIVPLVETVVRRWLKQQSRELTRFSSGNGTGGRAPAPTVSIEKARRMTRAVCARLIRRFMSPARGMLRPNDDTLVGPRLLDTHIGSDFR